MGEPDAPKIIPIGLDSDSTGLKSSVHRGDPELILGVGDI